MTSRLENCPDADSCAKYCTRRKRSSKRSHWHYPQHIIHVLYANKMKLYCGSSCGELLWLLAAGKSELSAGADEHAGLWCMLPYLI